MGHEIWIVGYVKDLDAAKKNDRVAANPYVVKAMKASGAGSSDLVISNADAKVLKDMSKNLNFLEQCRRAGERVYSFSPFQ